jgi:hypothetical protein
MVRPHISIHLMYLRTKMPQYHHRRLILPQEQAPDQEFEVLERVVVVICVELDDDHIGQIGDMVAVAEAKVCRVDAAHGTICDLRRRVREDRVPPFEKTGRVARRREGVVSGTMTCRY